jgi:hypothetical protein
MKSTIAVIVLAASLAAASVAHAADLKDMLAGLNGDGADQVRAAVTASPALAAQLGDLASSGKLTAIEIVRGNGTVRGSRFRADLIDGKLILTTGLLKDLKRHMPSHGSGDLSADNTVFVLGHLAFHALNDADHQAQQEKAAKDLWAHPNADGSVDATNFILNATQGNIEGEARAYIQGWNDVVDAAALANGKPLNLDQTLVLLKDFRYAAYFTMTAAQPGGSLTWEPTSGRIEPNDKNVAIMKAALSHAPVADIH